MGMIIYFHNDFAQYDLLEATEFIEYDEQTAEYLNSLTNIEQFPFAGYAAALFGLKKAFVMDRSKITDAFDQIVEKGWFSMLGEEAEFIFDYDTSKFAQNSFKIPDKFRKGN